MDTNNDISVGIQIVQLLFDDQGDPIDYLYLDVNSTFADFLGWAKEEIVGKKATDFSSSFDPGWFLKYGEIGKSGKNDRSEMFSEYHGCWFDVLVLPLGEHSKFAILHTDSRERKRMEQALRTLEEKYNSLFQSMDQGAIALELYDREGNPVGKRFVEGLGTLQAIYTEQKNAEEALKKSEERYRAFVRTSVDVVYHMSGDWSQMHALEGKKILEDGQPSDRSWMQKYIPADDHPFIAEMIHTAIMNKSFLDLEHRIFKVDGSIGWIHSRAVPMFNADGDIVEWFGTASDITKKRQAEDALRQSEERYRALFDNTEYGFALEKPLFDENGNVRDVRFLELNPAFQKQTGYQAKDFLGKTALEVIPHVGPEWIADFDKAFRSGQPVESVYYGSETKRWYAKTIFPFPGGLLAEQFMDITEHKRIEEEVRESEKKASALVAKLEATSANKNEFLRILSHELRNPLAAITAGLSVLEVSNDQTRNEKAMKIMRRQSNQLCKLVNDLLDITRIDQNKIKLENERIILNEVAKNALEDIKPRFEKKGVLLCEKIHARPIRLNADPIRITQCIANLLHNALKFTAPGGTVWISLKEEKEHAVISIRDNGIGISPEIISQLFEPFAQADRSLHRNEDGGLGLGLSIVKSIAQMYDGSVTASSDGLGKGSLFTMCLPLNDGDVDTLTNAVSEST
ncbi:MAG: ATP-binding protein [Limnochordia bacterium]|nr:ATP-binding protein [Limnochordia bacterium]